MGWRLIRMVLCTGLSAVLVLAMEVGCEGDAFMERRHRVAMRKDMVAETHECPLNQHLDIHCKAGSPADGGHGCREACVDNDALP